MKYFLFFILIFGSLFSSEIIRKLDNHQHQHIVAYGTSLTYGYWIEDLGKSLDSKYPSLVMVTNKGMPGGCSKNGIENLHEYVILKNPDTVFIEFSINDAYLPYSISLETSRNNICQIVDSILCHHPSCEIILMTMNIPLREHLKARPYFDRYYQIYRDVAKERNLLLIDHYLNWKRILDNDPQLYDKYVPDGIHPSIEGCRNVILPEILTALN